MADTKISALAAVAAVLAAQEFAVNDAGTSKKATALQIKTWMNPFAFLGRTQLGAGATNITVSFTAQSGFFIVVGHIAGYSAGDIARLRINGDAGNNYSTASSEPADAVPTTTISTSGMILGEITQTTARSPLYALVHKPSAGQIAYMATLQGDGSAAAATAITMIQSVALWANTVDLISSFVLNSGANGSNLNTGSYLEVYGIKNAASA